MLTRIISGAVGVLIAIIVIIFHDTFVLNLAIGLISAIMIYEILNAIKSFKTYIISLPSVIYGAIMPFLMSTKYAFLVTFVYVLCIFGASIIYHNKIKYTKTLTTIACSILISASMCTLISLHETGMLLQKLSGVKYLGVMYLIMGLCGAWIADTAAYFVGTFLGKNKLCPEISPKKTIEGFAGGILVTGLLFILINLVYSKIVSGVSVNYFNLCILGMLLAVVGTIGDLSASILKRQCGIKDYGNIMPGHGGLMDRFDSVLFVAPFLYAFVTVFDIYSFK